MATSVWTEDDRTLVREAILCKASGGRIVANTISGPGGDKITQFSDMTLDQLRALLKDIEEFLDPPINRPRIFRTTYDKGFRR